MPVSEQDLQALTPENQQRYISLSGKYTDVGAQSLYDDILRRQQDPPQPVDPRPAGEVMPTRRVDSGGLARAVVEARLAIETELIGQGVDPIEAKKQALAKTREIRDVPRTARGQQIPKLAARPGIETKAPIVALAQSFLRQPLIAPKEQETYLESERIKKENYGRINSELRTQAIQDVDARGVHTGGARDPAIDGRFSVLVKQHLEDQRSVFEQQARGYFFNQPGVSPKNGAARERQEEEILDLGKVLWQDYRDNAFTDVKIRGEVKEEVSLTARGLALLHDITTTESAEGIPYESGAGAAMRNLGSMIRPLTKAIMDDLSFETDENGKPLDEDDWNYKLWKLQEEALANIEEGSFNPIDYALKASMFVPVALEAQRTMGDRAEVKTGSYMRDLAISMALGRFLGDDFMDLLVYRHFWEAMGYPNVPFWMGMSIEMFLPVTPIPVLKPVAVRALKVGARTADITADAVAVGAAFASKVLPEAAAGTIAYTKQAARTGAKQVNRGIDAVLDPYALLKSQILYREGEALRQGLDVTAKTARAIERASTPGRLAEAMARDIAAAVISGKPIKTKPGSEAAAVMAELQDIHAKITAVLKGGTWDDTHRLANQGPQGMEIVDTLQTAALTMRADDVPFQVLAEMAQKRLHEHFANLIPNDYIQVGAYTMVTRKAYKLLKDGVNQTLKRLNAGEHIGENHRFARGGEVARAFIQEVGVSKIAKTARMTGIVQSLKKGEALTPNDTLFVQQALEAGAWRKASTESVKVRYDGAAWQRASVPTIRRLSVLRNTELIYRGVRAALKKGSPPVASVKLKGRAPIVLREWVDATQKELIGLDSMFSKKISEYTRKYGAGEGLDRMMADLLEEAKDIAIKEGHDVAPNATGELASIVTMFFGKSFNIEKNARATFVKELKDAGLTELTRESVFAAIDLARARQVGLKGHGLGTKVDLGFIKPGGDDVFAVIATWGLDKARTAIISRSTQELASQYPELLWGFGRRSGESDMFVEALITAGVPETLAKVLGDAKLLERIEPASRKEVVEQMMGELWSKGVINPRVVMEQTQRILEERVTNIILPLKELKDAVKDYLLKQGMVEGTDLYKGWKKTFEEMIISSYVETLTDMNSSKLAGHLGSMGLGIGTKGRKLDYGFFPEAMVFPGKRGAFVDADLAKTAKELMGDSASGKLDKQLEVLRLRDEKTYEFVVGHIFSFWRGLKRSMVSGYLGGTAMLNGRFLGNNNVSAPYIVSITAPGYTWAAVKAIPDGTLGRAARVAQKARVPGFRNASTWTQGRYMAKSANDVVLETPAGVKWTKRMLEEAIEKHNIRFSQVSFEFGDAMMADLRRAAGVNKKLQEATWMTQAMRWIDPRKKNIFNTIVEQADMAFREAVFRESLIRGNTVKVSAELARNALLDYGAISGAERAVASRYLLFYAFARQNTIEVVQTFLRDPGGIRNLRRIAVWTRQQHQEAGTWVNEGDYARTRLWARMGEEYDEFLTIHYGPDIPALIPFGVMANAVYAMFDRGSINPRRVVDEAVENLLQTPQFSFAKDIGRLESTPTAPDGLIDARYVVFFQSTGLWDVMQGWLDIESVSKDELIPGETVFKEGDLEVQYRFASPKGSFIFLGLMWLATAMGLDRNIRDWTSTLIRAGVIGADEETSFKRHGDGTWWLYALSLDTPMKAPSDVQIRHNILSQQEKELRGFTE